jgi:hypothetical protein
MACQQNDGWTRNVKIYNTFFKIFQFKYLIITVINKIALTKWKADEFWRMYATIQFRISLVISYFAEKH